LDVRTILLLWHPDRRRLLLLRRSSGKKLFPNLITGIGGTVELSRGEGSDLEEAVLRELEEETRITRSKITGPRLRLSTIQSRDEAQIVLLWFTAQLLEEPKDLWCSEGQLAFIDAHDLPLEQMIPTARGAIAFVASLPDEEKTPHNGVFEGKTVNLITNRGVVGV